MNAFWIIPTCICWLIFTCPANICSAPLYRCSVARDTAVDEALSTSVFDCLLGDMNKSINMEMGMQLPLPELCGGEKAGRPFMLCRMCTAQGCQARGTEIQSEDPGTGCIHPAKGCCFVLFCFVCFAVCGPLTVVASPLAEHRLRMRRLGGHGSRAQQLRGMWDLPRPGHEPVSPASAGGLSTTASPGKPEFPFFKWKWKYF